MISRKSFTLVEMLVVMGIVGTLAGIIIPTTLSARRQARDITCKNNLRQVGTAYMTDSMEKGTGSALYTEFKDNTNYPTMIRLPSGPTNLGKLYQGLQTTEIFGCPDASNYSPKLIASAWDADTDSVVFGSYVPRNFQYGASLNQSLNGFPRAGGNTGIIVDYNRKSAPAREKLRLNVNHSGKMVNVFCWDGSVSEFKNDGRFNIASFSDLPRFWREVDKATGVSP